MYFKCGKLLTILLTVKNLLDVVETILQWFWTRRFSTRSQQQRTFCANVTEIKLGICLSFHIGFNQHLYRICPSLNTIPDKISTGLGGFIDWGELFHMVLLDGIPYSRARQQQEHYFTECVRVIDWKETAIV